MSGHESTSSISAAELAQRLRRWEQSGATWHVLTRSERSVTVSLCRCDDGEEVERLRSDDPAAVILLDGRTGSDAAGPPPGA